ncbi:MAG: hypothetical protein ABSA16_11595 [Thermoguttaceae bacterium]
MPQGVNVNRPAAFVPLVDLPFLRPHLHPASDTGSDKIKFKYLHQSLRHSEDRRIRR